MCGIAGFVDFNKKSNLDILKRMTDVSDHRGPDDSGYKFDSSENVEIGLGHRRLSILDLTSHGHQPMRFESIDIVYNGEVYNFNEIKQELEDLGYDFESHSDTEVILKAYHKWGLEAVHKFNGMFAMAIYDRNISKLFLIRDRSGIKPLFYYHKNNTLLFASELKSMHQHHAFKKEIDIDAVALFLQLQYIPEPHSIFKSCFKLRAGHFLEIDLVTQKIEEKVYWDVIDHYNKPKLDISEEEAIEETEKLLKSAFEYRMVSDVPVGIFLSGGYDSSLVTSILQHQRSEKLKTFTIGFHENGFDEAPYAKQVAEYLGTEHHEYYCTQKDALAIIPKLATIYDEPFSDASAIPTTLVSQLARQEVTVSLSADGGDEIFAGYDKYSRTMEYYKYFSKVPNFLKSSVASMMGGVNPNSIPLLKDTFNFNIRYKKMQNMLMAKNAVDIMKNTSIFLTFNEVNNLLNNRAKILSTNLDKGNLLESHNDDINSMLAIDYKTFMVDDILTKVDRATMSVSLEGREPFLDYRIIEFVSSLPSHYKYQNGRKKHILKEITHKYLPKEMMDRPKMGFVVPIQEWFKDELKEYFLHYLDEQRLKKEGIFNVQEVVKLRDNYLNGGKENIDNLWSILMFEMWYEKWM
ncbi:MAG TPA: asparagine synthase (glutamine-hydrolyzing) [Campylobacterales bacterium]|nr:asparagine synthase (glutamine-hydrolyzing) [Campylobacterales bacterium]